MKIQDWRWHFADDRALNGHIAREEVPQIYNKVWVFPCYAFCFHHNSIFVGETKMLLKKFLMALAIALYSVVPVFAGDSDRARGHGQGNGAKMLILKAGEEGLISRYKREYQIAIGRHLTPDQRPLVDVPSHRFPMGRSKDAGLHWDKCAGKGWGKGYGKHSNKRIPVVIALILSHKINY